MLVLFNLSPNPEARRQSNPTLQNVQVSAGMISFEQAEFSDNPC